ncbi:glycoside hydrolase family 47 protein [Sporormia fimetaria CBS 119925]|uniref:alpha-1,2-Mannosidase n=1 Tax=Sporormia fimetaria CBS 119925 TaxID=1340428 RepID=A0A6A6VPX0_9PLEO|nr:glycoside hydrolase family 47 protein [Sporormia fimetaria CBS 119925]
MLRYRRYRSFVAFAVITLFVLYHLQNRRAPWREPTAPRPERPIAQYNPPPNWKPRPLLAHETKPLRLDLLASLTSVSTRRPPPVAPVTSFRDRWPAPTTSPDTADVNTASRGREHWQKKQERYPLPSTALIQLPQGTPVSIPKIQHSFTQESDEEKADREEKLDIIRNVFRKSWDGYRDYAWLQDELSPVSGGFRNPFAGWGATLVDALDTLWIMGLKEEFEEAVEAVGNIDFTTSPRGDIPLFETTIRYLGGLLAAHDLSDGKYGVLLEKATELAEVLISAFDTKNRMPITYYYWRPSSFELDRAGNRVVLAEIGSLSVEFTRLSQLTGDPKYYDAIARITDNLEEYQNRTRLAGMWPTQLDASGCNLIIPEPPEPDNAVSSDEENAEAFPNTAAQMDATVLISVTPVSQKLIPLDVPSPIVFMVQTPTQESTTATEAQDPKSPRKRQFVAEVEEQDFADFVANTSVSLSSSTPSSSSGPYCEETGLASSEIGSEEYTLGGMSDSTYEYLPKEWLLLGGQVAKYRTMYERSMDVVKRYLIFRPMVPDESDILFSGKLLVPDPQKGDAMLESEYAHLTCFAGGMFAMGAKLFDRPGDLDIARKLTDGCVWSYDMTQTGIMPEAFISVPCESRKICQWNETKYWEAIDPGYEARNTSYHKQKDTYEKQLISASEWYESQLAAMTAAPVPTASDIVVEIAITPTSISFGEPAADEPSPGLQKRQADLSPVQRIQTETSEPPTPVDFWSEVVSSEEATPAMPEFPVLYSPVPPLTHEEYVKDRITSDNLPKGVVYFPAKHYILRPEAIESVWYMYRITGERKWREAGWRMFEAVNKHTQTTYGNSAIDDVTKEEPVLKDEMESFWLAETLKYFYLLFADEDIISLDDWVLNTEAHPFKRPK